MKGIGFLLTILFFAQAKAEPILFEPIKFSNAEIVNENTVRIPFQLIDHLIVVEAELYQKKGNFVIDTGSETLILNKVHFPDEYNHPKIYTKSSGVLDNANAYEKYLEDFILSNLSLKNTTSHVIDLSHIEKKKKDESHGNHRL